MYLDRSKSHTGSSPIQNVTTIDLKSSVKVHKKHKMFLHLLESYASVVFNFHYQLKWSKQAEIVSKQTEIVSKQTREEWTEILTHI